MTVATRLATPADCDAVARLIDAMDVHYRGAGNTRGLAATRAMVERTMATEEGTRYLIAARDGADIGLACFAVIRPGRMLQGLVFLKDLFVVAAARGHGTGEALVMALARFAGERGLGNIDFTVEDDNPAAQRFYAKLGAMVLAKKVYRIDGPVLAALAETET
jgi:GNAT superfamily N-acetyltransferase